MTQRGVQDKIGEALDHAVALGQIDQRASIDGLASRRIRPADQRLHRSPLAATQVVLRLVGQGERI
jgi:hypothetical protein